MNTRIDTVGEFGLIERIIAEIGAGEADMVLGAGDDTAAVRLRPGALLLATCDSQVEGRHFVLDRISAGQLGRRLAAVNLSDIAAMGGRPRWALASFVLPAATTVDFVEEVCRGLVGELGRFGAHVIGGNLTGGDELVLDLTLLGEGIPDRILKRSGARHGDFILVTGDLGAAAAGRAALDRGRRGPYLDQLIARQLTPEARVAAGIAIAETGLAHAMIDISDGLAQDLGHLCDSSEVDAILDAALLPVAATTRAAADLGLDPLTLALSGGEDYELLCTAPAGRAEALATAVQAASGVTLTRIGTILPRGEGRWLQTAAGNREPLGTLGWQHFGGEAGSP